MRKAGLCILLLVTTSLGCLSAIASHSADDTITIASWNLYNLGATTNVEKRAEVIRRFDIVALQEVEKIEGLDNLLARVEAISGNDWEYIPSPRVGQGNAAEYYAFMYRTDRVAYVEESSGVYPEPMPDDFSREPFFATFRAGEFDFTLITVHITWGKLASLRTAECKRLALVWNYVQDLDSTEDDLILLGDFNRDRHTHSAFEPLGEMGVIALLTEAGTRTTFGKTTGGGYWYDNIWIDPRYTQTESTGLVGASTPSSNSYGAACAQLLKGVSDHCPVWAEFRVDTDDDPS